MEVYVGLNKCGNHLRTINRGTEASQCLDCALRDLTAFGQKTRYGALDGTTSQIEVRNVSHIEERNAGGLVARSSEQSDLYQLLDRCLGRGPGDIEHLCNRHFCERRPSRNGTFENLGLHLRSEGIHDRSYFQGQVH